MKKRSWSSGSDIIYGDSDDADDELETDSNVTVSSLSVTDCATCASDCNTDESADESGSELSEYSSNSDVESDLSSSDEDSYESDDRSSSSICGYSEATSYCVSDLHTIVGDSDNDNSQVHIKRSDVEWQKAVNEFLIGEMHDAFEGMCLKDERKEGNKSFSLIA